MGAFDYLIIGLKCSTYFLHKVTLSGIDIKREHLRVQQMIILNENLWLNVITNVSHFLRLSIYMLLFLTNIPVMSIFSLFFIICLYTHKIIWVSMNMCIR